MAEEVPMKAPVLPPNYVSIAVLRERWLERQKLKKQQQEEAKKQQEDEAKKEMECVDGKKDGVDDCGKGKGKEVVEEEGSGGVEKRGRNAKLGGSGGNLYCSDDGIRMNGGGGGFGGSRGLRDRRISKGYGIGRYGGDRRRFWGRRERIDVGNGGVKGNVMDEVSRGYGNRRVNVVEDDRRRFGRGLGVGNGGSEVEKGNVVEGFGNRRVYEKEGGGGDRRSFGRGLGVGKGGNEVEGLEDYGNRWIYEGEGVGGDWRRFGKGLGDRKGENEVKKRNVVDLMEDDFKVSEGSNGYGNRRINDAVDIEEKFQDLEISGGRKGENGVVKRYVVDVMEGNVVNVKVLDGLGERRVSEEEIEGILKGLGETRVNEEVEIGGKFKGLGETCVNEEVEIGGKFKGLGETWVNEEVEIGGKFRRLLRNGRSRGGKYGRDRRKFGKVLGVGKGENVVEKKQNVVDVRAGSEVVKGNVVDVREENVVDGKILEVLKGYGDRRIDEAVDIGRKFGDLKINGGGTRGEFRPRKEEKNLVAVREQNEAEKPIPVAGRKENEVGKPIAVAVSRENEVEKRNLVDVKEKNDVVKQMAVRDGNEVKKRNLVDVKMVESSKGHRRGNEVFGRKFGGLSKNGWRKGNVRYGRSRGGFGSWKNKQEESGMMWVKKADAEADTQVEPVVQVYSWPGRLMGRIINREFIGIHDYGY